MRVIMAIAASHFVGCAAFRSVQQSHASIQVDRLVSKSTSALFWRGGVSNEGDFGRLMQDIGIEISRQGKYVETIAEKAALANDIESIKKERRAKYGNGPLAPEELAFLEKNGGVSKVMELVDILAKKWGLDDDERHEVLIEIYAQIKQTQGRFSFAAPFIPKINSMSLDHIAELFNEYPPINPEKGIPDNDAVTMRFKNLRSQIKKQNEHTGPGQWTGIKFSNVIESPFGPLSSSACYEELSSLWTVNLHQLHEQSLGAIWSRTKIYLTIVQEAFVSKATNTVSILVEDDLNQRIQLQIFNKKNIQPTTNGLDEYPLGSRFFLKNPFLKVGQDGWLLLRVDQPFDFQRIDLPPLMGSILIFGEGDFSYAKSLAHSNKRRGTANITATSLDSIEEIETMYKKGQSNIAHLRSLSNVTILHNIDACHPSSELLGNTYDSILWNFPYQRSGIVMSREEGSMILKSFLENAASLLSPNGKIYLTLAQCQGGTTREVAARNLGWDVEKQAAETGYEVVEVLPFRFKDFSGYEPKRSYSDVSFPSHHAKIHLLQKRKRTKPGDAPSIRTILSRFTNFVMDKQMGRNPKTHIHASADKSIALLKSYAKESLTARKLLHAAVTFKDIMDYLMALRENKMDKYSDGSFSTAGAKVSAALFHIFCIREGELVCRFTAPQYNLVRAITGAHLISLLHNFISSQEEAMLEKTIFEDDLFDRAVVNTCTSAAGNMPLHESNELGKVLFVLSWLEMLNDDGKNALLLVNAARTIYPDQAIIINFCATVKANIYDVENTNFRSVEIKKSIIEDCETVLHLVNYRASIDMYKSALFLKAFVHRHSLLDEDQQEAVKLYKHYVEIVEDTDRHLPSVLYHIGLLLWSKDCIESYSVSLPGVNVLEQNLEEAREYYQLGLKAEQKRLPFFGPVVVESKTFLSVVTMMKRGEMTATVVPSDVSEARAPHNSTKKEILCSPIDVQILLEETGNLPVSGFVDAYKKKYDKEPFRGAKAKQVLQHLSKSGHFSVLERARGSFWLEITKIAPQSSYSKAKGKLGSKKLPGLCTAEQVRDILLAEERRLSLSMFVDKYTKLYGKHPFKPKKSKVMMKKLSESGLFLLDCNDLGSCFISLPKSQVANCEKEFMNDQVPSQVEERTCSAEQVQYLVTSEGGSMLMSSFREKYQQKFGTIPFPKKGTKKVLEELSKTGLFTVLCKPDGCTFVLTSTNDRTAEKIRNILLQEKGSLSLSVFVEKYKIIYGDCPFNKKKTKQKLKDLSKSGLFSVKGEGPECYLSLPKAKSSKTEEYVAHNKTSMGCCTAEKVRNLIVEEGGTVYLASFVVKYKRKYGNMPFTRKVKKSLDKLARSKLFSVECKEDGITYFLTVH